MLVDLHKIAINEIEKISGGETKCLQYELKKRLKLKSLLLLNEILDKENFLISVIIESENSLLDNKVFGYLCFSVFIKCH